MEELVETDPILEEIKTATGWDRIAKTPSGYVITFHENDAVNIRGLSKSSTTFFLIFESLTSVPICFNIIRQGAHFQYWTLNNQLHRTGDNPAYIMIDKKNNRYHRRWYWHGLMHRVGGPAEESVIGYTITDSDNGSHTREEFRQLNMEWWKEGILSDGTGGIPISAVMEDGWRYKNKATGLIDWNSDWPAFNATKARIAWVNPHHPSSLPRSAKLYDELVPTKLIATGLSEFYSQGNITNRTCTFLEIKWEHRGRELNQYSTEVLQFNDFIKKTLLTDIKLLDGPIFDDAETELLILTEYNRIFSSEELD